MTNQNPIANLRELLSQLEKSLPKDDAALQQTAVDQPDQWCRHLAQLTDQFSDGISKIEQTSHTLMTPIRALTALLRHFNGLHQEPPPNGEVMHGLYLVCDQLYDYTHALHKELDTHAWPDPAKAPPVQPSLNV